MNILWIFIINLALDKWRNIRFRFTYTNSDAWNASGASANGEEDQSDSETAQTTCLSDLKL